MCFIICDYLRCSRSFQTVLYITASLQLGKLSKPHLYRSWTPCRTDFHVRSGCILTWNCSSSRTTLSRPKLGLNPLGLLTCPLGSAQSKESVTCFFLTAMATLCHAPSARLWFNLTRNGAFPRRLYSNSKGLKLKDRLCSVSIIVNKSAVLSGSTFTVANKTKSSGKPLGKSDSTVVFIVALVDDRSYATSSTSWSLEEGSGRLGQRPTVSISSSLKLHWNSCTKSAKSAVSEILWKQEEARNKALLTNHLWRKRCPYNILCMNNGYCMNNDNTSHSLAVKQWPSPGSPPPHPPL